MTDFFQFLQSILDSIQVLGLGARWREYSSGQAMIVGLFLVAIGLGFFYHGFRIKGVVYRTGLRIVGLAGVILVVGWVLSALAAVFYFDVLNSGGVLVRSPVSPVTYGAAGVAFVAIWAMVSLRNKRAIRVGFVSAFVGTVSGAMIFELPFLFMISSQIGSSVEQSLFDVSPLFCLVFVSFLLLYLSPLTSVSRYALFSLGAMFLTLAGWVLLTNFSFPADPLSFALNSASKVLGFVSAFALFLHRP